jgi:hypothetical protein
VGHALACPDHKSCVCVASPDQELDWKAARICAVVLFALLLLELLVALE